MYEKVIKLNTFIIVLLVICFLAGCIGAFFLGTVFSKPGNIEYSGRDYEYGRQMGRVSALLESVDGRLGGIQSGFDRIKVYLEHDAGDLRRLAQRLRAIAGEVAEMENDLYRARSDLSAFYGHFTSDPDIELGNVLKNKNME